jgi:prevent-host-death family protein
VKHQVPSAEFVQQAGHWLNRVAQGDRVEVTHNGKVRAVLVLPEFAIEEPAASEGGQNAL